MFQPVARGADLLLSDVGRRPVQRVQRGVEAGVADDVEACLDPQQRARRDVGRRLRGREVQAAALPGGVAVVLPEGRGPRTDRAVDV